MLNMRISLILGLGLLSQAATASICGQFGIHDFDSCTSYCTRIGEASSSYTGQNEEPDLGCKCPLDGSRFDCTDKKGAPYTSTTTQSPTADSYVVTEKVVTETTTTTINLGVPIGIAAALLAVVAAFVFVQQRRRRRAAVTETLLMDGELHSRAVAPEETGKVGFDTAYSEYPSN